MKCLVFNGWAAGPETWALCSFRHDWVFDYVEQLDGLPERVMDDTEEAVLVGFSMGGSSALRMFLRTPEKVKGLVLVSATPCMMEDLSGGWKGMSERRLEALRVGTRMLYAEDPSPMYDEGNMARGLDYLRSTDLRHALGQVAGAAELPVTIFQSERDGIVRPQNAAYLQMVFPRARVVMVPGGEHVLPITKPQAIDAAVNEMMESLMSRERKS